MLLDDPFVLVAKRGDLPPGPYPTEHLATTSLVGYPVNPCQQEIEDGLRSLGPDPTFVFRTNDNGALIAMVRAGMGWAVMPLLAVDVDDPSIDVRALGPPITPRQVCLVWRRDRTLSPVASRLIEIATDVAAQPPTTGRHGLSGRLGGQFSCRGAPPVRLSPGTSAKRWAAQSALACSMRSGLDDTKFHQMWRRPIGRAAERHHAGIARRHDDGVARPDDGEVAGRDRRAVDLDVAVDDEHRPLGVIARHGEAAAGGDPQIGMEQRRRTADG